MSQEPGLVVPALLLSECGALAQGICSLEALTSLIVTCGVWASSSLTDFSSLKDPLIHAVDNSGAALSFILHNNVCINVLFTDDTWSCRKISLNSDLMISFVSCMSLGK